MVIYRIRNKKTGKCYHGQTVQEVQRYWKTAHINLLRKNEHFNSYLQRAWNKYGESAFIFEVVKEANSIEKLNELETQYVSTSLTPLGYNLRLGGGNSLLHETTKQKIGSIKKEQCKGSNNPFYGKHHTTETKEHLRKLFSKRYRGTGNPNYGNTHSPETIEKIKNSLKGKFDGERNPFFGKKHSLKTRTRLSRLARQRTLSLETRQKISLALSGRKRGKYRKKVL